MASEARRRGGDAGPDDAISPPVRPRRHGMSALVMTGRSAPGLSLHASCVAREDAAVLLLGAPGAGKSDLALRLLGRGFVLVADDRVIVEAGAARPPETIAGLLEVRGLGIVRLPYQAPVRIALAAFLTGELPERLPMPAAFGLPPVPLIAIDPCAASAAERIALALDCAVGRLRQVSGAFAA